MSEDDEPVVPLASPAKCLQCGYALRGLTRPRCPECGRDFNPADPRTMDIPGQQFEHKPMPYGTRQVILGVSIFILAAAAQFFHEIQGARLIHGVTLVTGLLMARSWRRRNRASPVELTRVPDGFRHWRGVLRILLPVCFLLSIDFHFCVHAKTFWIGPVGISYAPEGPPCGNSPHNGGYRLFGNFYWPL